jgi:flagellar hook-length control protein FliK
VKAQISSPLTRAPAAAQTAGRKIEINGKSESFGQYMSRRLSDRGHDRDQLGVRARTAATQRAGGGKDAAGKGRPGEELNLAGLLGTFMQKLKEISEGEKQRPGGWSFSLPDAGLLHKLGKSAGMESTDLANLAGRLNQEGELSLVDFFAALGRHFEKQAQPLPVIAPETDLPLLATLLSRMGLPLEQISRISEEAVVADGSLDLEIFLAGLETVEDAGEPASLTAWEAEQLRAMLSGAGAARNDLARLFPGQHPGESEMDLKFSREQLQSILRQTITAIEANRSQADLPVFFSYLDQILVQAGFSDNRVGWSPAVQQTVEAMYRELLQTVELAGLRIELAKGLADGGREETGFFGLTDEEWTMAALLPSDQERSAGGGLGAEPGADGSTTREGMAGSLPAELAGAEARTGGGMAGADGPKIMPSGPRLAPELQQQVFNQFSTGVLKGLNNNEHHLVLKLYPRQLGEVRVEMLVRDQQVSLAITMENSRVKDVLESSLGQFRENLERQGFTLGECMVSVNQRDDTGETWQRFMMAWKQQGARRAEGSGQQLRDLVPATMSRTDREHGFNIVV